jgi:signal transduction histidine kinase/ActR/RegA family two-component response regulator
MPHGYCLRWDGPLLFVLISSNLGIAIAYFAIPFALRMFVGKRADLPYPHMFKLFAAFILSCGVTHVAKVLTFYYPAYWPEALLDAWTAAISLTTAVLLYPLIPKVLSLRSPQSLQQINEQLESANKELAQVNDELKVARDQALEASNLKSAFVANVSHELRTPLSGVLGMNELILSTSLSEEQRMMAETVRDSARNLLLLVNDILDLSKIEAGRMNMEAIPMHPKQILEDVRDLLSSAAANKHIQLNLEIAPDLPPKVLGDPVRTHQVLLNLVGNAVKFTHMGRVSMRSFVESNSEGRILIRFEVSDTGIGMTQDEMRLLFMPFVQADMSTTRKYGGTGLGLTISKRLVELMGGQIGLTTEKGKGSTFWFSVPYKVLSADDKTVPPEAGGTFATADSVVLVVEDNQMMQAVVAKQLTSLGVTFRLCGTAEAALDELSQSQFGMILMDCHLPEMDGFDATREIRKREQASGKHIPIVAMTAGAMKGDPEKCAKAGMDDYLAKPYTLDQLREIVLKWMPRRSGSSFDEAS